MPNPYLEAALRSQAEKRRRVVAESEGYEALKITDLKAEIDRRNEDREDADLITPPGAKKADLIEALQADDATEAE